MASQATDNNNRFARVLNYKLVVVGETCVGKTSVLNRLLRGTFSEEVEVTVGACFCTHSIAINESLTIKFNIWDTAGQERYRSLAPMFYRGAEAAIIVYDVTWRESFDRAKLWLRELEAQCDAIHVVALAGNKVDLATPETRAVPYEEGAAYAKSKKMVFLETSAKTGSNVDELITAVAQKMPSKFNNKSASHDTHKIRTEVGKSSNCCLKG